MPSQAYTILESSTASVFMHLTTSEFPAPYWGVIMKSNGNGTYFGISAENVNRNDRGYVDFEKMINLDGIALINIVSNTEEATISGKKEIQSRITHNDGGTWKPLTPPPADSVGNPYSCTSTVSFFKPSNSRENYLRRMDSGLLPPNPWLYRAVRCTRNIQQSLRAGDAHGCGQRR